MPGLDHVNLQTTRLAESVAFYRDVIGLDRRDPPGLNSGQIQWMHDEQGRGILHLTTVGSLPGDQPAALDGNGTGAVHHVALDCRGHDAMIAKLEMPGAAHTLVTDDPNGMKALFWMQGANEFYDENGDFVETLDVWWFMNHYESYCEEHGLPINRQLYL